MQKNIVDKIVSLALLIDGGLFSVLGISAMNSPSMDLSQLFSGAPAERGVWMLVGGIVASVAGLATLMRGSKGG